MSVTNLRKIRSQLKDAANSIRGKTHESELLYIRQFDEEIDSIDDETHEPYEGPLSIIPKFEEQSLPTGGRALDEDIVITSIKVTTVGNVGGGNTLII